MPERLLRVGEVIARTGLSRSTIYLWMSRGQFPKPISLGSSAVAWLESEIDAWIDETVKAARN